MSAKRRSPWKLGLFVLALCAPTTGSTAEFRISEYQGQRVMLVEGGIEIGDAKRFENALQRAGQIAEVHLHSPGGFTVEGMAMGRNIRRRGLATRVRSQGSCLSACADVFLSGVVRRVENGGRIGVHMGTVLSRDEEVKRVWARISANINASGKISLQGVRSVIQDYEKISARITSQWVAYVLEMGASPRLVEEATKVDASSMRILTRSELVDLNIVNVDN